MWPHEAHYKILTDSTLRLVGDSALLRRRQLDKQMHREIRLLQGCMAQGSQARRFQNTAASPPHIGAPSQCKESYERKTTPAWGGTAGESLSGVRPYRVARRTPNRANRSYQRGSRRLSPGKPAYALPELPQPNEYLRPAQSRATPTLARPPAARVV